MHALFSEIGRMPPMVVCYVLNSPAGTVTRMGLRALRRWLNRLVLILRALLFPLEKDDPGCTDRSEDRRVQCSPSYLPLPDDPAIQSSRSPRAPPTEPILATYAI